MKEIIKYFGWVGSNNIGDEAIYAANRKLFSDFELIAKYHDVESDFYLFGGGTKFPVPKNSVKEIDKPNTKHLASIGVGVKDPAFRNRKYSKIDVGYYLGRAGKGHILRNEYVEYGLRPLSHVLNSVTVRDHYLTPSEFRQTKNFDYVGVRGPQSKALLERHGVNCTITGDTALVLEPSEYDRSENKIIGLTLRATGYKWENDNQYIDEIVKCLNKNYKEYTVKLIPFYPKDIALHIELSNRINDAEFVDYCTLVDIDLVLDEYAACDFVIGERLHANVLSACTHTPFLSIEYRPKSTDFAESIGMNEYNIKIGEVTKEKLNEKCGELKQESVISTISKEVDEKREKLESHANSIIESYRERDY